MLFTDNELRENRLWRTVFAIAVVSHLLLLAGCESYLRRADVPKAGRYTILTRDTGTMHVRYSAPFNFGEESYAFEHRIPELFKESVRQNMADGGWAYEYVPVEAVFDYKLPKLWMHWHTKSVYVDPSSDWYDVQEAHFREEVARIARENDLDMVIAISESFSGDLNSLLPMVGNGVQFVVGLTGSVSVYSRYDIIVYDPVTGRSTGRGLWMTEGLPGSRWDQLVDKEEPKVDDLRSFVLDIESAFPPEDLWGVLCQIGLVRIPSGARGNNPELRCQRAAYSRHKRSD